ncbi:hypothetical protein ACDY97_31785 [Rhizobium mongolense]|nr:hypothetical protein [Rhizobium sp. CC1099]WFU88865.1 hypothetical protein QA644_07365 [Rhizobium sp. CC1099]
MGKPVLVPPEFCEALGDELAKLLDDERRVTNEALRRLESRTHAQLVTEVRILRAKIAALKKGRP